MAQGASHTLQTAGRGLTPLETTAVKKEETPLAPAWQRLPNRIGPFPGGEVCITPNLKEIPGTGSDCHCCSAVSLLSKV